jgi:hypothetical protein
MTRDSNKIIKLQREMKNGATISEAAVIIGWSRQRAHRYFAEGTLVNQNLDLSANGKTKVNDQSVKNIFGVYIYDVLKHGDLGGTMKEAARHMPDILLSVVHAYNAPISRLANFFSDYSNHSYLSKNSWKFIRFCADEKVGVKDKIAVAKYVTTKDWEREE